MVQKKYLKLAAAGLAVTAIVTGLSVGLTQRNKNNNQVSNVSSSNAVDFDAAFEQVCDVAGRGKSGKSGGSGGSKSSKSNSMSMSKSSKSASDAPVRTRHLVVPGTEDVVEHFGDNEHERRTLRRSDVRGECGFSFRNEGTRSDH